jgi:hypothetical protein
MKVKIKSFNGELPDYLTAGKEYPLDAVDAYYGGYIHDDNGKRLFIVIEDCASLNGGSWEVVG